MNNKKFKKTILIDLDGVLNTYTGNYNKDNIPPVKDGAKEFISNLAKEFNLKLFTTREKELALKWLTDNGLGDMFVDVTNIKEPSFLYIDDRCIRFDGDYEKLQAEIDAFEVWWKKN